MSVWQRMKPILEPFTEFIISVPLTAAMMGLASMLREPGVAHQAAQEALKLAIGVDASMLSLVLASLAVATAVARPEFIRWLKQMQLYDTLRRPFWWTSVFWATHLASSTLAFIASYGVEASRSVFLIMVGVLGFLFSYALAATVGLVVFVFQLAEKQAEYDLIHDMQGQPADHGTK